MNNLKPNYPTLLKAFICSCKPNKSKEERKFISQTVALLMNSEDWAEEKNQDFKEKKELGKKMSDAHYDTREAVDKLLEMTKTPNFNDDKSLINLVEELSEMTEKIGKHLDGKYN